MEAELRRAVTRTEELHAAVVTQDSLVTCELCGPGAFLSALTRCLPPAALHACRLGLAQKILRVSRDRASWPGARPDGGVDARVTMGWLVDTEIHRQSTDGSDAYTSAIVTASSHPFDLSSFIIGLPL